MEGRGTPRSDGEGGIFYADDGVVVSTDPGWLQSALYFLTDIFDLVGLRTKVRKTLGVVVQPFRTDGVQADKSYTRRMTGEGGGGI